MLTTEYLLFVCCCFFFVTLFLSQGVPKEKCASVRRFDALATVALTHLVQHFTGMRGRQAESGARFDERGGRKTNHNHSNVPFQHFTAKCTKRKKALASTRTNRKTKKYIFFWISMQRKLSVFLSHIASTWRNIAHDRAKPQVNHT